MSLSIFRNRACVGVLLITASLLVMMIMSPVGAARCQIANVSYLYPQTAPPNQQIEVDATIAGSCETTGMDYYSARADVTGVSCNYRMCSNSTPIGYDANNFNVTVHNWLSTPNYTGLLPLQIHVYVIRAGGTSGGYLLDYQTVENATIKVGSTPVPEFQTGKNFTLVFVFAAAAMILTLRRRRADAKSHS
jgi:hypothetical protein